MLRTGYIGLGSNLGPRERHLAAGIEGLERRGLPPDALSSVWETDPVDSPEPLPFLNMVARVSTRLGPFEVLDLLLAVEREVGRVRTARNAPRTLDLDLLLLGDLRVADPRLELPHPRMWSRRFVLAPLAEIDPTLREPDGGRAVAELLAGLRDPHGARRLGPLATTKPHPV